MQGEGVQLLLCYLHTSPLLTHLCITTVFIGIPTALYNVLKSKWAVSACCVHLPLELKRGEQGKQNNLCVPEPHQDEVFAGDFWLCCCTAHEPHLRREGLRSSGDCLWTVSLECLLPPLVSVGSSCSHLCLYIFWMAEVFSSLCRVMFSLFRALSFSHYASIFMSVGKQKGEARKALNFSPFGLPLFLKLSFKKTQIQGFKAAENLFFFFPLPLKFLAACMLCQLLRVEQGPCDLLWRSHCCMGLWGWNREERRVRIWHQPGFEERFLALSG